MGTLRLSVANLWILALTAGYFSSGLGLLPGGDRPAPNSAISHVSQVDQILLPSVGTVYRL